MVEITQDEVDALRKVTRMVDWRDFTDATEIEVIQILLLRLERAEARIAALEASKADLAKKIKIRDDEYMRVLRLVATARAAHELKAENERLKTEFARCVDEICSLTVAGDALKKEKKWSYENAAQAAALAKENESLREQLREANEDAHDFNTIAAAYIDKLRVSNLHNGLYLENLTEELSAAREDFINLAEQSGATESRNTYLLEQLRTARAEEREKIIVIFKSIASLYNFDFAVCKLFFVSVNAIGDAEPQKGD